MQPAVAQGFAVEALNRPTHGAQNFMGHTVVQPSVAHCDAAECSQGLVEVVPQISHMMRYGR